MPQLVKGGKWIFGWVIVGPQRELRVPPAAWDEYGFQDGDEVILTKGSRSSGGFGLSHARLLAEAAVPLHVEALARSRVDERGHLVLPTAIEAKPGDRLLAVRGSGRALGFVARGSIFEEAPNHSHVVTVA